MKRRIDPNEKVIYVDFGTGSQEPVRSVHRRRPQLRTLLAIGAGAALAAATAAMVLSHEDSSPVPASTSNSPTISANLLIGTPFADSLYPSMTDQFAYDPSAHTVFLTSRSGSDTIVVFSKVYCQNGDLIILNASNGKSFDMSHPAGVDQTLPADNPLMRICLDGQIDPTEANVLASNG